MSERRVAYRYAKPLIEESLEKGNLDQVNADIDLLIDTCKVSSQFQAVLKNPIIRGHKKPSILQAVFSGKIHSLTEGLFKLLVEKKREGFLYAIALEFRRLYQEHKNIQEVNITSAVALDTQIKSEIKDILSGMLNKTIQLEEKVDPTLLGGFVVKVGDRQIDNSVRNNLQKLKLQFLNKIS